MSGMTKYIDGNAAQQVITPALNLDRNLFPETRISARRPSTVDSASEPSVTGSLRAFQQYRRRALCRVVGIPS